MWLRRNRVGVAPPKTKTGKEAFNVQDGVRHAFKKEEDTWNEMECLAREERVFFEHLLIANDGGMSEIGEADALWYSTRYFAAVGLILFVLYNNFAILHSDYMLITVPANRQAEYLVSAALVEPLLKKRGIEIGHAPVRVMGWLEAGALVCLQLCTIYHLINILISKGMHKWSSVILVCWELLPELSIFSAMRLLAYIVPQQLVYDLNYALYYDDSRAHQIWFFISRPLFLLFGMDCFLIRYRTVKEYLVPDPPTTEIDWTNVGHAILFMNQLLGVVQISKTIKFRLYRFIFGGEDGIMSPPEKVRQNVWEMMVAEEICQQYSSLQAWALLLTWCDDDFQLLALNETALNHSEHGGHRNSVTRDDDGKELPPLGSDEHLPVSRWT